MTALTRVFEQAFRQAKIPYQVVGGVSYYERQEVKDVLAYLNLLANPKDDVSFNRVVNVPPRGIGKTTLDHLAARAESARHADAGDGPRGGERPGVKDKAARSLRDFGLLIDELTGLRDHPAEEVIRRLLDLTGYRKALADESDGKGEERLANLDELISAARDFDREHPGGTVSRVPRRDQPGVGRRPLEGRQGGRHVDDAPCRQGSGIPGRLHRRPSSRASCPTHGRARTTTRWRRSVGSCSSGSPGPSANFI